MKFTLSWLLEHLQSKAKLDEICDTLNLIGLEVEAVTNPADRLAGFEVAEIIACAPHPNADKLQICTVASSQGTQELVCGAPNAKAGLKTILAREGAVIPANGMVLGKAKIRGVESCGMLCSPAELELSDDGAGIIELDASAAVGMAAAEALGQTDAVIEIAVTPNRPDCLGVRGIARDLAAAGLGVLKEQKVRPVKAAFDNPVKINVTTPHCPAFAGCVVRGVKNTTSPDWLAQRLRAIGLRPINALVDITNYISYDLGRPLHVYDMAHLSGAVTARAGIAGEVFTALDEREYKVTKDDCVIADDKKILGFGGVMGGADSGCTEATTDVLIESAYFTPQAVAETGRRHNLDSDARHRFERGIDPQSVEAGLALATRMVVDLCGGKASGVTLAGKLPPAPKAIAFDPARVQKLTGVNVPQKTMQDILQSLGFAVRADKKRLAVTPPSWRPDIDGAADLVEEIIRIYGLDKIPPVPLPRPYAVARPVLTVLQKRLSLARRVLAGRGMVEAVTWSFIPHAHAQRFGAGEDLRLANPISVEMATMRPSLLPGLLQAVGRNLDKGLNDFALFEIGQAFTARQPNAQHMAAAGVRCGHEAGRHWAQKQKAVDVYAAKGDAEAVLASYGVDVQALHVAADAPDWYHPARSGVLSYDKKTPLAVFGALHPQMEKIFDIKAALVGFEVYLENLPAPKDGKSKSRAVLEVPKFQAVRRDFAFEVGAEVAAGVLIKAAWAADKKLVTAVRLFDAFEGGTLGAGRKSLGLEVVLQPTTATLTDAEIDAVSAKIIAAVEKASGGKLRG